MMMHPRIDSTERNAAQLNQPYYKIERKLPFVKESYDLVVMAMAVIQNVVSCPVQHYRLYMDTSMIDCTVLEYA